MKNITLIGASHSAIRNFTKEGNIVNIVEPITSNLELLDKFFDSTKLNKYHLALGSSDGKISINLSLSWDSHSLFTMKEDFDYYWEIVKQTGDTEVVNINTWDTFTKNNNLTNIDVCLMDVEGAEGDILRHMTINKPKELYVSHYHSNIFKGVDTKEELLELMIKLGYKDIEELEEELHGYLR